MKALDICDSSFYLCKRGGVCPARVTLGYIPNLRSNVILFTHKKNKLYFIYSIFDSNLYYVHNVGFITTQDFKRNFYMGKYLLIEKNNGE